MPQENIQRYHPLGQRTLLMFIFEKTGPFFAMLVMLFFGMFALNYVPSDYVSLAIDGILGYFVLMVLVLVGGVGIGYLQYWRYWIFIDDKDLKIARGLIATEQIGIPYRHVQDIKIERTLLDQLFGVSDIVITVVGGDDNESAAALAKEDTIILPSVAQEIALEIQDIVLKKAQVQQINVLGNQK